jgi:hypothetical protein
MSETANQTSTIPNRKQRRLGMKHQGFLKQKSKLPFKEWLEICREIRDKGKEIHQANIDAAEKIIFGKLEQIENSQIANWKEEGYTKKEIEKLREAYAALILRDKENWHAEKKIARNTLKELRSKLAKRK